MPLPGATNQYRHSKLMSKSSLWIPSEAERGSRDDQPNFLEGCINWLQGQNCTWDMNFPLFGLPLKRYLGKHVGFSCNVMPYINYSAGKLLGRYTESTSIFFSHFLTYTWTVDTTRLTPLHNVIANPREIKILHLIYYWSVLTQSLTGRHALKGSVHRNQSHTCNRKQLWEIKSAPGNEC